MLNANSIIVGLVVLKNRPFLICARESFPVHFWRIFLIFQAAFFLNNRLLLESYFLFIINFLLLFVILLTHLYYLIFLILLLSHHQILDIFHFNARLNIKGILHHQVYVHCVPVLQFDSLYDSSLLYKQLSKSLQLR